MVVKSLLSSILFLLSFGSASEPGSKRRRLHSNDNVHCGRDQPEGVEGSIDCASKETPGMSLLSLICPEDSLDKFTYEHNGYVFKICLVCSETFAIPKSTPNVQDVKLCQSWVEEGKLLPEGTTCIICQCDLTTNTNKSRIRDCYPRCTGNGNVLHHFHLKCLAGFAKHGEFKSKDQCSCCRAPIFVRDNNTPKSCHTPIDGKMHNYMLSIPDAVNPLHCLMILEEFCYRKDRKTMISLFAMYEIPYDVIKKIAARLEVMKLGFEKALEYVESRSSKCKHAVNAMDRIKLQLSFLNDVYPGFYGAANCSGNTKDKNKYNAIAHLTNQLYYLRNSMPTIQFKTDFPIQAGNAANNQKLETIPDYIKYAVETALELLKRFEHDFNPQNEDVFYAKSLIASFTAAFLKYAAYKESITCKVYEKNEILAIVQEVHSKTNHFIFPEFSLLTKSLEVPSHGFIIKMIEFMKNANLTAPEWIEFSKNGKTLLNLFFPGHFEMCIEMLLEAQEKHAEEISKLEEPPLVVLLKNNTPSSFALNARTVNMLFDRFIKDESIQNHFYGMVKDSLPPTGDCPNQNQGSYNTGEDLDVVRAALPKALRENFDKTFIKSDIDDIYIAILNSRIVNANIHVLTPISHEIISDRDSSVIRGKALEAVFDKLDIKIEEFQKKKDENLESFDVFDKTCGSKARVKIERFFKAVIERSCIARTLLIERFIEGIIKRKEQDKKTVFKIALLFEIIFETWKKQDLEAGIAGNTQSSAATNQAVRSNNVIPTTVQGRFENLVPRGPNETIEKEMREWYKNTFVDVYSSPSNACSVEQVSKMMRCLSSN